MWLNKSIAIIILCLDLRYYIDWETRAIKGYDYGLAIF